MIAQCRLCHALVVGLVVAHVLPIVSYRNLVAEPMFHRSRNLGKTGELDTGLAVVAGFPEACDG